MKNEDYIKKRLEKAKKELEKWQRFPGFNQSKKILEKEVEVLEWCLKKSS